MTDTLSAPGELGELDSFIDILMEQWKIPGLGLAIAHQGKIVVERGYGQRNLDENLPQTADTLQAIGSATKAFATMSLALLADEGKLDWDTLVREYLPDFRMFDPMVTERMTPRDLVTHRSGLPRYDLMWYRTTATREQLYHRLRYLEPNAGFRAYAQYQNLMYMTAGYLAGKLTGQSWEELVQTRIFEPLGMHHSGFSYPMMRRSPDHALPYKRNQETEGIEPIDFYEMSDDPDLDQLAIGPAGSIISSPRDMAQWLLLHLNGGKHNGHQFVSEGQLMQMHSPQMVFPQFQSKYLEKPYVSYGMGWFIEPYRGHTVIHHGGNIDGYSALVSFMPQEGIGAVILVNLNGSPVRDILVNYIYDRLLGLEPVDWNARIQADWDEMRSGQERRKEQTETGRVPHAPPSHELGAYTGEFEHPAMGRLVVTREGDELQATFNRVTAPLRHYHYDIFELEITEFDLRLKASFLTNTRGDIDRFSAPFEPSVPEMVFTRVPPAAMTDPAFLGRLAGEYDLNGSPLSVTPRGGGELAVQMRGQPELTLVPYRDTEFVGKDVPDLSLRFVLDQEGTAEAVIVTTIGGVFTAPRV